MPRMPQLDAVEEKREQARALKEEGNALVREGRKSDALKKYEKGIRFMGLPTHEMDETMALEVLEAQSQEGRELLSILASNAAQMYMDPSMKQLGKAIERCSLAIEANPNNAKAYFRRAAVALEHADNLAKGVDALLAQGQNDVRKFLQMEPASPAGQQLQEQLGRKRQVMMGPMMRDHKKAEPEVDPDWFQQVKSRAIFVCLCGSTATGRDQVELPEALLSMALQAKDKKAISVGVAYVGYRAPDELEMFTAEWQKKYYRMLQLGERATKVPTPRQVVVHGEVYNLWSLLEGRVRVMRVAEFKRNGEKVDIGWMRYCAQLLWHGEPFVYQSCRPYLRFAPRWDEHLKNDLAVTLRRAEQKPVLSWVSQPHEEERWQWVSDKVDYEDNCHAPPGAMAATRLDEECGWIGFRRRFFSHCFGVPASVAFFSAHNAFSTSEILTDVPADPLLNSLKLHGQLTCENIRLHSVGWDVYTPCANYTWDSARDLRADNFKLEGVHTQDATVPIPDIFAEQKEHAEALLDPWENRRTRLEEEVLDLPLPTPLFWTSLCPKDPSPWETGRAVGNRFVKGTSRTMTTFERQTGVDLVRREVGERARNAGFNGDRDFEDSRSAIQLRERNCRTDAGYSAH